MNDPRIDTRRVIRAPRGSERSCKSWLTEAAYRMIQNNLDPEVAEHPQALVVYGGIGRAARAAVRGPGRARAGRRHFRRAAAPCLFDADDP